MSINPVAGAQSELSPASANERMTGSRSSTRSVPSLETAPKQNPPSSQSVLNLAQIPEDEVEVQREPGNANEIVIRYVDHSGRLVLQVPSTQVLDVARGIDQNLAQAAKDLAGAGETSSGANGGKPHGH